MFARQLARHVRLTRALSGEKLKPMTLKKKLAALKTQLDHHDHLYFVAATPSISDAAYDGILREYSSLVAQLPEADRQALQSRAVAPTPDASGSATIMHRWPMLSLDKVYDAHLLAEFDGAMRAKHADVAPAYVCEPKIDGVAVSAWYSHGQLVKLVSRGDGMCGEDLTAKIPLLAPLPPHIPVEGDIEVRGEAYLPKAALAAINGARAGSDVKELATCRNATAGALRRLPPSDKKCVDGYVTQDQQQHQITKLNFAAYQLLGSSGDTSHIQQLQKLQHWGFAVAPEFMQTSDMVQCIDYFQAMERKRDSLSYDADGIVVKVDSLEAQNRCGTTGRAPKWALAVKFAPKNASTVLKDIVLQVSRFGTLVPVACFRPVTAGGVVMSRASLHNVAEICRQDIRLGDTVEVHRAGDVIPQIVRVVPELRPATSVAFSLPHHCPSCSSELQLINGEPHCMRGSKCPAQLAQGLVYFAGRDAMNIQGLGPAMATQLVDNHAVRHFTDLYTLTTAQLTAPPLSLGPTQAANLVDNITRSKSASLAQLIVAIGIPSISRTLAARLAFDFPHLHAVATADITALKRCVGPTAEETLRTLLDWQQHRAKFEVQRLRKVGVASAATPTKGAAVAQSAAAQEPSKGFVLFTGKLQSFTRAKAAALLKERGYTVVDSFTKQVTLVVSGGEENSKVAKARKIGISIWDEQRFLEEVVQK